MKLRVQRVATRANWSRPRVLRLWGQQGKAYRLVEICLSVILAGWSYELWVQW